MDEESTYLRLKEIVLIQFSDIVLDAFIVRGYLSVAKSLRIHVIDNSFIEVWLSGYKYSYHWERRSVNGTLYRHDNAPHHKNIVTYPKHFHEGSEYNVMASTLSSKPERAICEFMEFVRKKIKAGEKKGKKQR